MSTVQGADRFERSTRFWLRAYPVRWRAARGDELLGVLRDLAGPDATRLPLREALGLVRAGWATRWREGPPLRTRLTYRLLEIRIPPRYREWARDDIDGRWFHTRRALVRFTLAGAPVWTYPWLLHQPISMLGLVASIWAVVLLASVAIDLTRPPADRQRMDAAKRHLIPPPDEVRVPGGLSAAWVPRPRTAARTGAPVLLTALALATVVWSGTSLLASRGLAFGACPAACAGIGTAPWHPSVWAACAAVATAVGLLASRQVRRRLDRLTPGRPVQQTRSIRAETGRLVVVLALIALPVGWLAWVETSDSWFALVSPVAGLVALAALPGAVTACRFARTGPEDLALIDLWRISVVGRMPRVDAAVLVPVRLPVFTPGPTVPGSPTGPGLPTDPVGAGG